MEAQHVPLPPGDDEFNDAAAGQQHGGGQQFNPGFGGWWFPPGWQPGWPPGMHPGMQPAFAPPPPPQQAGRGKPPKVELPPFWIRDPKTWFTLTESKFQLYDVTNSRLMFNFVLPALSEDTLEQVRDILHAVDTAADPYKELKDRLLELYTPGPVQLGFQLLHSPELGDRRPSVMMASMLALLPPGEVDGILFKCVFLSRLPMDIRDQVTTKAKQLTSKQLGQYADELWFARNARNGQFVMAATPPTAAAAERVEITSIEEVTEGVAAVKVARQPRAKNQRGGAAGQGGDNTGGKGGGKKKWLCWRHATFKKEAFKCDDPRNCSWSGNE